MAIKHILLLSTLLLFTSCASRGSYFVNIIAKLGEYQKVKDIPYNAKNNLDIYIPDKATDKNEQLADKVTLFHPSPHCQTASPNQLI